MQRVISLKPLSSSPISPQRQKRIRAERFASLSNPNLLFSSPASPNFALTEAENMPKLLAKALQEQLSGIQQKGKMMKTIIA